MESNSLELLHTVQLDMLVKFNKFCKENNLTYFLDSGSALGAVRHNGFIPWDDDVDIAMPRDDYNRLKELGEIGLPDNLYFQTYRNDSHYMCPFGKIRLGDSYFPDIDVDKMKYQGIYIDVFPYDRVPDNHLRATIRVKISRILWFICTFSRRRYPGKNLFSCLLSSMLHRLSNRGKLKLYELYDWYCTRYDMKNTKTWTCFSWNMSQYHTYFFSQEELFPTDSIVFEGKELKIMRNAHSYLTKMYGDYSVPPPEEKRRSHLKGRYFRLDNQ